MKTGPYHSTLHTLSYNPESPYVFMAESWGLKILQKIRNKMNVPTKNRPTLQNIIIRKLLPHLLILTCNYNFYFILSPNLTKYWTRLQIL